MALTLASVSNDLLLLLLLLDASVKIDALSVRRLFAVAAEYVVGLPPGGPCCPCGARCGGSADAGVVGNGWLNVIDCETFALL